MRFGVLLATIMASALLVSCSTPEAATTVGSEPPVLPSEAPSPEEVVQEARTALTKEQIKQALLSPEDMPGKGKWRVEKEQSSSSSSASSSVKAQPKECQELLESIDLSEDKPEPGELKETIALAKGSNFEVVGMQETVASYPDGAPVAELERITDIFSQCDKFTSTEDGVTSTIEVFPLSIPNYGDRSFAFRLQASVTLFTAVIELVYIVVGDNIISLTATGLGGIDEELMPEVAARAVAKVNAVAAGEPWVTPTDAAVEVEASASPSGSLRPAEEAREDDNVKGEVGTPIQVNDIEILVSAIRLADRNGTQGDGRRVAVELKVSNLGTEDASTPQVNLVCRGIDRTGDYYVDSTLQPYEDLPARSFDEGIVILGQPEDVDPSGCSDPRIRIQVSYEDGGTIDIPVPAGVLG
jgi:hypothetical protein